MMQKHENNSNSQNKGTSKNHYEFKNSFSNNEGQINIGGTVNNIYKNVTQTLTSHPVYAILSVAGIFTIVILMVIFFAPPSESEASKTINSFQDAIIKEDIDTLKNIISVDDDAMEMKEKYLQQLIKFSKENTEYLDKTIQIMQSQKALYEDEETDAGLLQQQSKENILNSGEFYLKKESGLFSDSYVIGVRPQYLEIYMQNDNGIIKVDNKAVLKVSKTKNNTRIGPLFPGEYQVYCETYFDYAKMKVTDQSTVSLFGLDNTTSKSVQLTGNKLSIRTLFSGVKIYLNNQPTPFVVGEDKTDIYPVKFDGSQTLQGVVKFPWGESRSEKFVISNGSSYSLTPPLQEKAKKEAWSVVEPFLKSRAEVLMKKDVNAYKGIMQTSKEDFKRKLDYHFKDGNFFVNDFAYDHNGIKSIKFMKYELDSYNDYEVRYNKALKKHEIQLKLIAFYEMVGNDGKVETNDLSSSFSDNYEHIELWVTFDHGEWKVVDYSSIG
jgi:hypothetical protein